MWSFFYASYLDNQKLTQHPYNSVSRGELALFVNTSFKNQINIFA